MKTSILEKMLLQNNQPIFLKTEMRRLKKATRPLNTFLQEKHSYTTRNYFWTLITIFHHYFAFVWYRND